MSASNLAFVFPGQGSQSKGMLADMAQEYPIIGATFSRASEVLGYDLWDLCQNGEDGAIDMTEVTQPLLLTASYGLWQVWQSLSDIKPAYMAGHSLGEWSALTCSGVVAFEDAVRLVRSRGQFMQEAVAPGVGSMAAIIGVDDDLIRQCCESAAGEEVVSPVNYNSPGQVVIAGHKAAVERAIEACKAAGAKKAVPLAVSAPFHTSLMKPAADRLASLVAETEFKAPVVPVIHNVHAQSEVEPERIKEVMIQQIYQPVLWVDCVQALAAKRVTQAVECGPGKVLCGLIKRIDRSISSDSTDSIDAMSKAVAANSN
ncbi:ACP S-malonyltransferase [Halioxenophilus sp. WMMB6]|uniref:ACP S-malonyltransferase n=1 Tax=Halioxenophilus sp. WMMB6 TaxID=3073815 RepID=UPI00295F41B4|nr:ACP S-malonyltransferase [Halioxenophilus sp. WMMB6]